MLSTKFVKKEKIANNTWQFWFDRPTSFIFDAGQYTTLFLGKENRDFTICADTGNEKYFSIVTKPGISEFKKDLFTLLPNSKISLQEPAGGFVLRKKNAMPKVFLAGGIGITPFYSMICSHKKIATRVTLIASFSKKKNICFEKDLEKIAKENKNIRIIYTISQEKWNGEEGRISETIIKKYVPNFHDVEFMIAGGEQMVYDTEDLLHSMKVKEEKIRIDIFTGYV